MIEYFRHEVLNRVSVISGFCEIINHHVVPSESAEHEDFRSRLEKIGHLVVTFNDTLSVFREGCVLQEITEDEILKENPTDNIIRFLTPVCGIQFSVLSEIAVAILNESMALDKSAPDHDKTADRCSMLVSSAVRLNELFLHPIAYLQEILLIHRRGDSSYEQEGW